MSDKINDKEKKEKENNINQDLDRCEKEKEIYLDNWKRERADFINYKKEETKRVDRLIKIHIENLILELMRVIDDFGLASKQIPEKEKGDEFIKGFFQIQSSFQNFLKNQGVEEIDCLGEFFDPHLHEAIEVVDDKGESGKIVEEVEKGYRIGDRLLRPSKVKIIK